MKRSGFGVMMRLVGLVKPLIGYMILAILMGLCGHLAATFITILGGYSILTVLEVGWSMRLTTLFAIMLGLALLRGVLRYAEQTANHYIAFKLLAEIRSTVFGALRRLAPAKLEVKDKGNLISMITSDIELLEVFYAHTISPIFIALFFSIIMIAFIGSYHPLLGLLAAVAYITVGVIVPMVTSRLSGDDGLRFRTKAGALSGFVLDSLRGLSETIQYGQGEKRLDEMMRRTDELAEDEGKMKHTAGRNVAITNTVILAFNFAMLFAAARLTTFDGTLITTVALMSSFGPVVALAMLGATLQQTFASGNRVLDILDEEPQVEDVTGEPEIAFSGAAAEDVTFAYDDEVVLSDFSVTIPKNQIVGLCGRSGSGKSTFLKLLMRFWTVGDGEIRISDSNINAVNTANLRQLESYVTQETHLFHDSIRNNLRIAKLDATDDEIISACKKASVHDFIMTLPEGYATEVGELGEKLSGGERQRLGLARAFLRDAPFMLLDEPTSNLDSINEATILRSLDEAREGKTVVLVSHRKSTMSICDVSYTVENGRMS